MKHASERSLGGVWMTRHEERHGLSCISLNVRLLHFSD